MRVGGRKLENGFGGSVMTYDMSNSMHGVILSPFPPTW